MRNKHGIAPILCILTVLAALSPIAYGQRPIELISYSRVYAEIVVADEPSGPAVAAAGILQQTLYRITGQQLQIRSESEYLNDPDRYRVAILVGNSKMAKDEMDVDVEQSEQAGDHYVIKADYEKQRIVLAGNDDGRLRGTVYAVYDLLQRSFGCGWYTPDPLWQVIPRYPQASVIPFEVDEKPAFVHRVIWLVEDPVIRDAWRMGGRPFGHGHALGFYVPREKYEKEHPDYFGQIQPCLTHLDVIKITADVCRQRIDKYQKGVIAFSLSPIDGGGFCDCDRCRSVGNISARILYFANQVAKELSKTHPDRYLLTFYAYWFTHSPPDPMLQAEPGVCVMQVNEGDHLHPWDQPEWPGIPARVGRNNTREIQDFAGWQKTGAQLAIYEWWIPGVASADWKKIPWYSGQTGLRNQRYWRDAGVKYLSYETKNVPFHIRWPLFYVGARGMWHPDLTFEQIMSDACKKLYGLSAEEMLGFYQVLEKAAYNNTMRGKNWGLPTPVGFYTRQVVAQATAHLEKAAALTEDATILARIAQERAMWDEAVALMDTMRVTTIVCDGKTKDWPADNINGNNVRWLHGIPYTRPIFVVKPDGSKKELGWREDVTLEEGVWFTTQR